MIKVENVDVWGFEHAIRGMRNPKNSWDKSDSYNNYSVEYKEDGEEVHHPYYRIGASDLDLMKRLYKAGTEHRTYARMVQVSMDIVAPLYWWKEMDRYTVGKSQVSCSTMHKIAAKEFELDDFSHEHLTVYSEDCLRKTLAVLNVYRRDYVQNSMDKTLWWQLIQLLPSSYNQRRTVCMSYETVFKIIKERTGHKLDEWNDFVQILGDLPHIKEITEVK